MGDRWKPGQLSGSHYIWRPLVLKLDGSFTIEWRDRWNLADIPKPGGKIPGLAGMASDWLCKNRRHTA
jgi:hypothetical protein